MAQIHCPFCHQDIDEADYPAHQARHLKPRADGQLTDYATLPEEDRETSDLSGVPRVYVHQKCGVATQMPEQIIRTYLKDPSFYSDDTYCCGCRRHVPSSECVWKETGENLQTYTDRLRAEKRRADAARLDGLLGAEAGVETGAPAGQKPRGCLAVWLLIGAGVVCGVLHVVWA